jgi:DNA-directed RNA polymerase subunit omega|tara:strand:+ start:71105 stop:71302 length:198 start_codon:yes stop_codon:yes gene_type:complete
MARVTIEDCLEKVTNRFELSVAAMKRAKSIHSGAPSLSKDKNKPVVSALREIAEDKVVAVKKSSE